MYELTSIMGIGKKIIRLLKRFIVKVNRRLSHPNIYVSRSEKLINEDNLEHALKHLHKGLVLYPNNFRLRQLCACVYMEQGDWARAVTHWKRHYEVNKHKMKLDDFLNYSKALTKTKKINVAIEVLTEGLNKYPLNDTIILRLANLYKIKKQWEKLATTLLLLLETENPDRPEVYLDLSKAYIKLGHLSRAEYIIRQGINLYPNQVNLIDHYVDIAIRKKNWTYAIKCLEHLNQKYGESVPFDLRIKQSMLYQIIGKHTKAQNLFDHTVSKFEETIKGDKQGYRRIILYDNGESRIEFYKTLGQTNQVIVTFDSINMIWSGEPFGFKFLRQQNLDIVAVRKREKQTYHQDLSLEDFVNAVKALMSGYKRKFAYGFSLGAYSALYYASNIDCHILALAPRLSIHPLFGKPQLISQYDFNHNLLFNFNSKIRPIIVYDPKNKMDHIFINKEIKQAFPKLQQVKVPYGGHSLAPHLLNMGVLKEFVLKFLNEEVPKYERKLRLKSANYYRILGGICLRRNKMRWAGDLADRAYKLKPNDYAVIRFKVNVYRKLNRHKEALSLTKEAIESSPKDIGLHTLLIDLYIEIKDLIQAEKHLKNAINTFGERPGLVHRRQTIDKVREEIINTPLALFEQKTK